MTPLAWLLASTTLCASPGPPYEGPWRWPLAPVPRVLRAFEAPPEPWAAGHRGVDLVARPGQTVYAAGGGRVTYAARLAGRGVIVISHGELRTTYLPVRASVRAGGEIRAGGRIGTVESRAVHCGQAPCLHWGLLRGPAYVDPLSLLGAGRIRLLPVWGVPPPQADPPVRRPAQRPLPLTTPPKTPHPPRAARLRESAAPRRDPSVGAAPPARHLPLVGAASGAAALAIASARAPRKTRRPTPP
ncbi:M23 family metallopeptidase [Actinomadura sp. HBU206391]|nr:M23 family metallopeptidase [Actinomadura sp. HBU206391]